MIFYVYLDPQIISTAQAKGNLGVQALTGILHALSQNCFLAEFKTYSHTQEEIGEQLKNIVGDFDIKALKVVLKRFVKERLFVECLDYDYSGMSEIEMVQNQCAEVLLDLLILGDNAVINSDVPVEIATLGNYQSSDFAFKRSRKASEGITLTEASLSETDFLENYFKKVLKYARSIDIFDFQCGEKYKDNYDYTLNKFLSWLETVNKEDLTITFHCGFPGDQSSIFTDYDLDGLAKDEIKPKKTEKLAQALNAHYSKSTIKVVCYDSQPAHDRYVITDQVVFSIGRGMDFLDGKGKIRDISINFKNAQEVKSLLS